MKSIQHRDAGIQSNRPPLSNFLLVTFHSDRRSFVSYLKIEFASVLRGSLVVFGNRNSSLVLQELIPRPPSLAREGE